MFDMTFDIVICLILGVAAVLLLTGKGKFILTAFRGKENKGKPLPYEEKKLSICMGILCLVLLGAELIVIFFAEKNGIPIIISMVLVIVAFVAAFWYLRKYAKVEIEPEQPKTIADRVKELQHKM